MDTKRGALTVIYRETKGGKEFLLLHRILNWIGWEPVKGGIEKGETLEETAKRETLEETGLSGIKLIKKLDKKLEWESGGKLYSHTVFIAKASGKEEVKLEGSEHDSFEWLPEKEAIKRLNHKETKEIFELALKEIGKNRI